MGEIPKKILVMRLRGLGDVILATPVIENLHRAFPQAQIDFLTERPSAGILQNHPALNEVLILDRSRWQKRPLLEQMRANLGFIRTVRARRYDLVIDLFGNPRTAILTYLSGAPVRVGFRFRGRRLAYNHVVEPRGDRLHAVEFNLDILRALAVPIQSTKLHIEVNEAAAAVIEDFWRAQNLGLYPRVIAFNAFGGWYTKRWPLASFAALGDRLQRELSAKVILLWGPGEWQEVNEITQMMQTEAVLAPPTDLLQLAALLGRVQLLIANDSGPMHLAAALNTPVVGIFGPTRPHLQGPWGEGHKIVVHENLPCLGCNGLTCRIKTHDCMQNLSVEKVFRAAVECLAPG
jgi:predicted lipopolysaccharide heptosyltransferase III